MMNYKKICTITFAYRSITSNFHSYRTKNVRNRSGYFRKNTKRSNNHYYRIIYRSNFGARYFDIFSEKKKNHSNYLYYHFWAHHDIFSSYHRQIRILHHLKNFLIFYRDFLWNRSQSLGMKIFFPYWRRS